MTPDPISVENDGGVLHVVLDAPTRRNALSLRMLSRLREVLGAVNEQVGGIVVHGARGTFSAGADFRDLAGSSSDTAYDEEVAAVAEAIRSSPRVVVAALEGPCIGAAADLALACDLRVAAQGSYVQVPAVRLGLLYNPDAVARLRQAYPRDSVRRLLLLAERFDAEEALAAGLVSLVVPRGEAAKRAHDLLAGIDPSSLDAIAATKALLRDQESGHYDSAAWGELRLALLDSPQRRAAIERAHRRHANPDSKATDR